MAALIFSKKGMNSWERKINLFESSASNPIPRYPKIPLLLSRMEDALYWLAWQRRA
jgi:hypothetical protein